MLITELIRGILELISGVNEGANCDSIQTKVCQTALKSSVLPLHSK